MPGKARVDKLGALPQIIAIGINRARIFKYNTDCNDFLSGLELIKYYITGKGTKLCQDLEYVLLLGSGHSSHCSGSEVEIEPIRSQLASTAWAKYCGGIGV